jgi:hypothetical protein
VKPTRPKSWNPSSVHVWSGEKSGVSARMQHKRSLVITPRACGRYTYVRPTGFGRVRVCSVCKRTTSMHACNEYEPAVQYSTGLASMHASFHVRARDIHLHLVKTTSQETSRLRHAEATWYLMGPTWRV